MLAFSTFEWIVVIGILGLAFVAALAIVAILVRYAVRR